MRTIDLNLRPEPRATCRIRIGEGALDRLAEDIAERAPGGGVVVVSDSNVAPLQGEPLRARLARLGQAVPILTFPAGETQKTRETKAELEDQLGRLGLGRDGLVVAVGGGVTGDLAGFLAATWNRGVPFLYAPTSLLAMVDAAVGGKTAVNLPSGKNQIGAFHHPEGVYADPRALATLPEANYREGFSEVVKLAVVADARLFSRVEAEAERLRARDGDALEGVIASCLRIKGRVVARDFRERGRRAVLNFGHTVGHALETASGHTVSHGEAVAIGMVAEARLATHLRGFPAAHLERLRRLLSGFRLPVAAPKGIEPEHLLEALSSDKKSRSGKLRMALPLRIGRMPEIGRDVTTELDEVMASQLAAELAQGRTS